MQMYETTDFYLACFLRCIGFDLGDVRREGARSVFAFRDRPDRREMILAFYNGDVEVQPLAFVGIIKEMKSLIHNT